jgi:hypothetical protein
MNVSPRSPAALLLLLALGPAAPGSAPASTDDSVVPTFSAELELGTVWQSRNDVRIPNSADATRFSLTDVQGHGPWPVARLYVTWNIDSRHSLRALAAPLSVTETGRLPSTTSFAGTTFAAGVPTEAIYRFNSWRLTYAYRFRQGSRWGWWIGATAKIRDAKIELDQDGVSAAKTDLGFVPLLHLRAGYRLSDRASLVLDLDALAGGPGRAEDGSLKLYVDFPESWSFSAGYRTVEGGADVDEVYNFAWLHYAVASVAYRF